MHVPRNSPVQPEFMCPFSRHVGTFAVRRTDVARAAVRASLGPVVDLARARAAEVRRPVPDVDGAAASIEFIQPAREYA